MTARTVIIAGGAADAASRASLRIEPVSEPATDVTISEGHA
jgi:hypothetical protein